MPELPADFDLKMMPDWLKEPATKNPYADYEGRDEDRRPRGRGGDDWGGRGRQDDRRGRPGGGQRPGGAPRSDAGRRDDRGRRDAPGGRKPDGRQPDRGGARQEDRRGRPGEQRRHDELQHGPPAQPANVTIEFFPDESCAVSIARQIKSTHRAYSLFDLARMFLARPERHRLKITTKSVAEPLYQVGEDGPVLTDRAAAERTAFPIARGKYYEEVTERHEAPKGNFTNVARCRSNGVLLGPTNYHGYQPALRRLYEERFSRRMPFSEFQREIEVVTDAALVEQWKEQSSSVTVFRLRAPEKAEKPVVVTEEAAAAVSEERTVEETAGTAEGEAQEQQQRQAASEAPAADAPAADAPAPEAPAPEAPAPYEGPVFASINEIEQHFRENYLSGLIRTASSFHLSGEASRELSDRGIAAAVRQAWEQERGFPGQMMHQLRQQFSRSGLHVFKHRKRMQFVSLIRPSPMENGNLSPGVAEILRVIQADKNCARASLAAAILGADETAIEPARKATLATDLRWLIETGSVIEFSDGRLELPLAPAKPETPAPKAKPEAAPQATPEAAPQAAAEAAPAEAPEPPAPEPAAPAAETAPEPAPAPAEDAAQEGP